MTRKLSFSDLIRSTRIRRGLTVSEIAERVGVSVAAIYMWETDRGRPRDTNLSALCKIFEIAGQSDQGDGCRVGCSVNVSW
jgi:transcriptional regulator with XRE-family HTH domain